MTYYYTVLIHTPGGDITRGAFRSHADARRWARAQSLLAGEWTVERCDMARAA